MLTPYTHVPFLLFQYKKTGRQVNFWQTGVSGVVLTVSMLWRVEQPLVPLLSVCL
jgi:hypothetical protein